MPAPDPLCGIIAGSLAHLYKAQEPVPVAPATGDITWVEILDLDNYTFSRDSTDTSLNTGGWIRTLPMERGMTITATGRVNTTDPGQQLVEEEALDIGCDALGYYRFYLPSPHAGEPAFANIGFWAWANMQDVSAATTDPFSWGVELRVWSKPTDLDENDQPVLQPASATTQTAPTPTPATSSSSSSSESATTSARKAAAAAA